MQLEVARLGEEGLQSGKNLTLELDCLGSGPSPLLPGCGI